MKLNSVQLLARAIADAVRTLAAALRRESCCPPIHYAGLR